MVTRTLYAGVIALWFLADHVLSQVTHTTVRTFTPTSSALISTSTFVSPSLRSSDGGGLSDKAKVGISVGVTLSAIIIGGSLAILCVKMRRNKAISRPQIRVPPSRDVDDENMVGSSDTGKGKQAHYMSAPSTGQHGVFQPAPNGAVYQGGGPVMPNQAYLPQQQTQASLYPTGQYGQTYDYSGITFPGPVAVGANLQHDYAGPSNTQYQLNAPVQSRQQQQQGGDLTWIYPASNMLSPVDSAPLQDLQDNYLQDYQPPQGQALNSGHNQFQNGGAISSQDDAYYVPLPHPHASELPEQRRPVELMGEGHYKEAP